MAAPVALNAAFMRMGFSQESSAILADVNKENLTIASLQYLDDKGIKTLCASLRKPGGTMAGPIPAGGGVALQIPNPGVYVSTRAEMNMAAVCYMARHHARTTRTMEAGDITLATIQTFTQYKEAEEAYKEPTDAMKLKGPEKIIDFIDDWPEHIALYNGQNGRPLSYVLRETVDIPDEVADPTFGEFATVYGSLRDEIAARAEHATPQFQVDNAKVFELLNDAIGSHKHVKTWIKSFTRARDGRGAWIAFKAHYRGSNEIEAIEAAAEKALETGHYTGEKPRYNFETHVSKHLKAHLDIEKATGTALAENTKVRKLLYSLRCATMNVPIATIRAQENLRNSFDESINYLRAFILSTSHGDDRNVSGVSARSTTFKRKDGYDKTKKGKVGNNNGNKPLDRYYKPDEWWKLSEEVRAKILVLRKNRNRAVGATTSSDRTVAAAGTSSSTAAAEAEDTTEQTTQRTKRVKFTN
jgi:hypothetical protein